MKRMWMAALAISAAMTVGCNKDHNGASGTVGTAGRNNSGVSSSDRNFVQDVSQMNADEIDLSRLAAARASNADVKKFAQRVLDDHTAAGEKLSGVATQNGIETRGDLDDSHRKLHDTLAAKQGLDFDKDTVEKWKGQVAQTPTGEKAKVDMKAQTVVPEKSDNEVTQRINAWAAETYPVAYAHQQAAKTLKDTLKHSTN
jgi:putative membrane protein